MAASFRPFQMGVPPDSNEKWLSCSPYFELCIWFEPSAYVVFLVTLLGSAFRKYQLVTWFQSPSSICNIIILNTAINMPCLILACSEKAAYVCGIRWYANIFSDLTITETLLSCGLNSHPSTCESLFNNCCSFKLKHFKFISPSRCWLSYENRFTICSCGKISKSFQFSIYNYLIARSS